MNRSSNINMYEGLASYFLPTGILEYFEVTDFTEIPTQDTEVLYTTLLKSMIHLTPFKLNKASKEKCPLILIFYSSNLNLPHLLILSFIKT
jgi:hypothetical protein